MIAASRRRRPGVVSTEDAFRLHLKLARLAGWHQRLLRGSLAALAGSIVALILSVGLTTHAAVIASCFTVGCALPVPGLRRKALTAIRASVGMSYETALDLVGEPRTSISGGAAATAATTAADAADAADPYGLKRAVIERARLAVADVAPPPAPAWWLPALAVALALLLVSGLDIGGTGGGSAGNGLSTPPSGSSVVPVDDRLQEPDGDEQFALPDEAPGRAQEPEPNPDAPNNGSDEDNERNIQDPAAGSGDGAPLSRFLDSLRERPPETGGGQQPGQDQADQGAPPERQQGGAGREGAGEPERVEMPSDPNSQSGADGQAGAAGDDGDGGDQEGGDPALAASQAGDEGDSDAQAESESGDSRGQAPGEQQAAENQPTEGGGEGEQGFEAGTAAAGEGSDDSAGDGAAGAAGGAESAAGVAEGRSERPEFLRGVLEDGPESPAGAVRLPGQTDVSLPPGSAAPADYAAAAEEALSEGDLPLSYQEIIRRYFR